MLEKVTVTPAKKLLIIFTVSSAESTRQYYIEFCSCSVRVLFVHKINDKPQYVLVTW